MTRDKDQLRLLSVFHYVVGGLAGLFALFPIFHLVIGLIFVLAPGGEGKGGPPPALIGWMFVSVAAAFIIIGWVFAAFVLAAGRFLAKRKD